MKIGQLAEHTGVSPKAIRYYEEIGIMPAPKRSPNGYRMYDRSAGERIAFVRDAQSAGLSLRAIQTILELRDRGESTCGHVIGILEEQIAGVERQMDDLARTHDRLDAILQRAKTLDREQCTDPDRCQTIPKGTL